MKIKIQWFKVIIVSIVLTISGIGFLQAQVVGIKKTIGLAYDERL